nr:hypothetical protein [Stenotrophomonas pavanii]
MSNRTLILCLAIATASPAFADAPLSIDRTELGTKGEIIIVRRTTWPDFDGGQLPVDQHLKPDGFGRLIYRYSDQPEATKLYHQAFCASMDMEPSQGEGTIEGPAAGWVCTRENTPGNPTSKLN